MEYFPINSYPKLYMYTYFNRPIVAIHKNTDNVTYYNLGHNWLLSTA